MINCSLHSEQLYMLNYLLNKSWFMIVSLLIISETARLCENIVYENIAKDWLEDDSLLSLSIILEINLFLLILFERIAYKKYEIEKFVKKYDCKKENSKFILFELTI